MIVRRLRAEGGFTLPEVLMAILLITIALIPVASTFDVSKKSGNTSEGREAASQVVQQEIERLRSAGYDQLLLNGTPGTSSDPKNPLSGVGSGSPPTYKPTPDAEAQPLAIGDPPAAGDPDERAVDVTPTNFTKGNVKGTLYRFVTWGDDASCGAACPGTQDYKRLTVAAMVTTPTGIRTPVISSTQVINPDLTPPTTTTTPPPPPAEGDTYYFYDTPATFTTRQDPTDHNARDTQKFPDLMDTDPPPDPNPDPSNPTITVPLHNYTLDVAGTYAGGAAIQKSGGPCQGGDKKHEHEWVTNILPSNMKLSGNGFLDLFTETVLGGSGPGMVCVQIWDVPGTLKADGSINGSQIAVGNQVCGNGKIGNHVIDTLNPTQCGQPNPWPFGGPQEVQMSFRYLDPAATYYTVAAGRRIGVYLTTADKIGATATIGDLAFAYDTPDYPGAVTLTSVP